MKKQMLICLAICLPFLTVAQIKEMPRLVNHKENPALQNLVQLVYDYGYIEYESGITFIPETFFLKYREAFELDEKDRIELFRTSQSIDGATTYQYQQYHDEIKVLGGGMNMRVKDGKLISSNGRFIKNLPSSEALVTGPKAAERGIMAVPAERYRWEVPAREADLKAMTGNSKATYFPKPQLVYMPDRRSSVRPYPYVLTYKVPVLTQVPYQEQMVYIGARDGEIVEQYEDLADATANTMYNGVVNIETFYNSGTGNYILLDQTRGNTIETCKQFEQKDIPGNIGHDFIYDDDDDWGTVFSDGSNDQAGLDVHYGTAVFFDYFSNFHGQTNFHPDGTNQLMRNHIHSVEYPRNAVYSATDYLAVFGDNEYMGTQSPLTCLDIVTHEWGHAWVRSHIDGGALYAGEPKSINEGLADLMETIVAYYELGVEPEWLHGDECYQPDQTPRNPVDPHSANQPLNIGDYDYYFSDHAVSSILGRWFYLLTEGGSGMTAVNYQLDGMVGGNGAPYSYEVGPVGLDISRDILVETIANRLSNVAGFSVDLTFGSLRDYTIQVAVDFYGACSYETQQVMNAWYAVGNLPVSTAGYQWPATNLMMEPEEICDAVIDDDTQTFMFESYFRVLAPGELHCNSNQASIESGSNVICRSAQTVIMKPGFHAKAGSNYRAYIGTCQEATYPKNNGTPSNRNGFDDITQDGVGELQIYPNPSTGRFGIEEGSLPEGAFQLIINAVDGKEVYRRFYGAQGGDLRIDVSALNLSGVYIVSVQDQNEFVAKSRIVLQ